MQRQAGGQSLVLVNGRSYQGVPTQQNWQLVQFKQYSAVVSQPISLGQNTDLSAAPTWRLFWPANAQKQAEFQWRMSLPLATIVVSLLGVAFCYISPRKGRYGKLLNALLLFIVYFNFISVARSALNNGSLSPWIGVWWVHIMFALAALYKIVQLETGRWPGFSWKGRAS